ncbi:hypothetical protein ElyMa_005107400 [Elysia marginata]|uniref:Uncharacterized protein n=1 Tax=Elysia marginata TaxID=1093978 RepID=A0AAV4JN53_9GAST|nr:hypothetical protein ElyMa_005107400 [Elysia marginata]
MSLFLLDGYSPFYFVCPWASIHENLVPNVLTREKPERQKGTHVPVLIRTGQVAWSGDDHRSTRALRTYPSNTDHFRCVVHSPSDDQARPVNKSRPLQPREQVGETNRFPGSVILQKIFLP